MKCSSLLSHRPQTTLQLGGSLLQKELPHHVIQPLQVSSVWFTGIKDDSLLILLVNLFSNDASNKNFTYVFLRENQ